MPLSWAAKHYDCGAGTTFMMQTQEDKCGSTIQRCFNDVLVGGHHWQIKEQTKLDWQR